MRARCEERKQEASGNQHRDVDRKRSDDCAETNTEAAKEDVPGSAIPVCHPDKERTGHLTDLNNGSVSTTYAGK